MSLYESLNDGPGRNVAFNALPALAWARANGMGTHALALVHLAWQSNAAVESTATVRGESAAKRKAEGAGLIAPGLSTGDALRRIVRELTSAGMPADMAEPWVYHYGLGAVESEGDPVPSTPVDNDTHVAQSSVPLRHGGVPYVTPVRTSGNDQERSVIYHANPDLIDRGTAAHMDSQDAAAGPPDADKSAEDISAPNRGAVEESPEEGKTLAAKPAPMQIVSWQHAEQNAANWMRYLGFTDARVTAEGTDGGVDVIARGAIAQVKFQAAQVGRPALQRLVGARGLHHDSHLLFFSGAGYSQQALTYAEEMRMALFVYALDGSISARTSKAHDLLREAERPRNHTAQRLLGTSSSFDRPVVHRRLEQERQLAERSEQGLLMTQRQKARRATLWAVLLWGACAFAFFADATPADAPPKSVLVLALFAAVVFTGDAIRQRWLLAKYRRSQQDGGVLVTRSRQSPAD